MFKSINEYNNFNEKIIHGSIIIKMKNKKLELAYNDYWFHYVLSIDPNEIKKLIKEDFIVSDGLKIHLDIYDNGANLNKTVIFIHGTSIYSRFYAKFCYKLFKKGFRIVLPDMRGHGLSEGKRGHFTMDQHVKTVFDVVSYVLERYGEKIAVMGSSLGGITSLYSISNDPRIKTAICHNAAIFNEKAHKKIAKTKGIKRLATPLVPFMAKITPKFSINIFNYLTPESLTSSEVGFKMIDDISKDKLSSMKYTLTSLKAQLSEAMPNPIETIKNPVMLINGSEDGLFSVDYMEEIYTRLTCDKKKLEIIQGATHFLFQEYIDESLKRIVSWLNEVL